MECLITVGTHGAPGVLIGHDRLVEPVRLYLRTARELAGRAGQSQQQLRVCGAEASVLAEIERLLRHTRRQVEQIERRVLKRETIPHGETVFSIFDEHTRWCAKGKAGRTVELGVPVAVVESEQQFVLHWQVMWAEQDVEVACPLVRTTQAQYPQLQVCSFDRGFHSQANRAGLEQLLEVSACCFPHYTVKSSGFLTRLSRFVMGGKAD